MKILIMIEHLKSLLKKRNKKEDQKVFGERDIDMEKEEYEKLIQEAREADLLDYFITSGYKIEKHQDNYYVTDYPGLCIKQENNQWYHHYTNEGRTQNSIDCLTLVCGRTFKQAVMELTGHDIGNNSVGSYHEENNNKKSVPEKIQKEKQELIMPEHAQNMRRLFAYFCQTRKIPPAVVEELVKADLLYQTDSEVHSKVNGVDQTFKNSNAVFIHRDNKSEIIGGEIQGLNSFKRYIHDNRLVRWEESERNVIPGWPSELEESEMKQSIKKLTAFVAAMSIAAGQNTVISYSADNETGAYDELKVLAQIEENAGNYDFDNNGKVDIFDAYALNIFVENREALPAQYAEKIEKYGDINGDGAATSKDIDIFTPYCCYRTDIVTLPENVKFDYGTAENASAFNKVLRACFDYESTYSDKYNLHRFSVFSKNVSSGIISLDINDDQQTDLSDFYDIWLFDTFCKTEHWNKIGISDSDKERIAEKCSTLYADSDKYTSYSASFLSIIARYILTSNDVTVSDLDAGKYTGIYGSLSYETLNEETEMMEEHNICDEFAYELSGYALSYLDISVDYENITVVSSDDLVFTKYADHAVVSVCSSSSDSVVIPSEIDGVKVTKIGDNAFYKCTNLRSVSVPDTVTEIGGYAFAKTSLESIEIPDGVKVISSGAFSECEKLAEITGAANAESVGIKVFEDTPWLEEQKKQNTFVCINGVLTDASGCTDSEIVIPDGVTAIGAGVFYGNNNITSVVIPDSVTRIDNAAFGFCMNLEKLVIPDTVTYLGESIITYCEKLETVNIPAGLTEINNLAFYASRLRSVNIPEGVTSIGENAFRDSVYLENISIPVSVNSIGSDAFYGTAWLDSKRAENPLVMFGNIIIDGRTCSGDVIIPDGAEKINGYTFAGCTASSIYVPDSVKRIESRAFSGADCLEKLRLPENPEYVGRNIITSTICEIVYGDQEEVQKEDLRTVTGDIDLNGKADLSDLTMLSVHLMGEGVFSEIQSANADVDFDSEISIADLARFKQYVVKDIITFEK